MHYGCSCFSFEKMEVPFLFSLVIYERSGRWKNIETGATVLHINMGIKKEIAGQTRPIRWLKIDCNIARLFPITLAASFFCFLCTLRWQVSLSRFFLPIFFIFSPGCPAQTFVWRFCVFDSWWIISILCFVYFVLFGVRLLRASPDIVFAIFSLSGAVSLSFGWFFFHSGFLAVIASSYFIVVFLFQKRARVSVVIAWGKVCIFNFR